MCCSVLECVAACENEFLVVEKSAPYLFDIASVCSVLQCVAVCCSVLQRVRIACC